MIFVFGNDGHFDRGEPFFTGEFNGIAHSAIRRDATDPSAVREIDVDTTWRLFRNRFGENHPATTFWFAAHKKRPRCVLSSWAPSDSSAAFIERGWLEPNVYMADRVPWIWDENAYSVLNGSHLYGLTTYMSDFDATYVADAIPIRSSVLSPSIRTFVESSLSFAIGQGNRHLLELLFADPDCVMSEGNKGEIVAQARALAVQTLRPYMVMHWHDVYEKTYKPIADGAHYCGDRNVARWILEAGWPYKIGYYLLVDAIIAKHFCATGTYSLREPFKHPEIREVVLRCKIGKMSHDTWAEHYAGLGLKEMSCSSM